MFSLRRTRRSRRPESWSFLDTSSADTMSIASSERSSSSGNRHRDTGFPESFCGNRNTSLPHPDADTSGHACITQEDISVARVLSRQRRTFLNSKNKRTISHGYITPEMEQMYSQAAAAAAAAAVAPPSPDPQHADGRLPTIPSTPAVGHHLSARPTSGGGDSFTSASTAGGGHGDDDAAPPSPPGRHHRHSRMRLSSDSSASSQGGPGRRTSFLGRLGIHRHHD